MVQQAAVMMHSRRCTFKPPVAWAGHATVRAMVGSETDATCHGRSFLPPHQEPTDFFFASAQSTEMAISIPSIVAIVCLVIAIALAAAGLATPAWYTVSVTAGANTATVNFGLFKSCDSAGVCRDITFTEVTAPCTRTVADQKLRWDGVLGLSIAGLVLAAAAIVNIALGMFVAKLCSAIGIILAVVAASVIGIGMALWVYTIENWFYCDKKICDGVPSGCTSNPGYSFILMGISLLALLIAFILQTVAVVTRPSEAEQASQGAAGTNAGASPMASTSSYNQAASPAQKSAYGVPQGGDWVFDESSGLYWSQQEYLYLDTSSGHYFDPNTQMWYDPSSQQWYHKQ